MRTGIFGGTFDPPHKGHIEIAKTAVKELGLDELIVLPSGDPPHKTDVVLSDKYTRYEMAELAFDGTGFSMSDYEIKKESLSYTCETLEHFSLGLDGELFFIVGGDSLKNLSKWKCPEKILKLATLFVVGREVDTENEYTEKFKDRIIKSHADIPNVSSTEIRLKSRFGLSIAELVPEKVCEYIEEKGLYKKDFELTQKVRRYLKESRYIHTYYVTKCALKYAKALHVSENDAFTAAVLHDVAKYADFSKYEDRLKSENVEIPDPCKHAFVGSYIIKEEFGIENEDIINAVKYHTTGRAGMSNLEKLILLCDTIEETRDFDGVEELRRIADEDFDLAIIKYLESTIERINKDDLCKLTSEALTDLRSKYGTESIS